MNDGSFLLAVAAVCARAMDGGGGGGGREHLTFSAHLLPPSSFEFYWNFIGILLEFYWNFIGIFPPQFCSAVFSRSLVETYPIRV